MAPIESMLSQHTDFVHQRELYDQCSTRIWRSKDGAPLDRVSATSMRTAEVTIYISPSTVTARLETQVVEDNFHGVVARVRISAHGSPARHLHRTH